MPPLLFDTVLAWLVTYAAHSTLLLGGAGLLLRLWPRMTAELQSLMWKAALVGAVATCTAQACLPLPRWLGDFALSSTPSRSLPETPASASDLPHAATTFGPVESSAAMETHRTPAPVLEPAAPQWHPLIAGLWMTISGLLLARLAWHLISLHGIPGQECREPQVLQQMARVRRQVGMRAQVRLLATADGVGPMAAGLFRYRIYCPAVWLRTLDREQLRALLAHEVAHLARGDTWWNLVSECVCAVGFFQPLNWLARRQIREQAEFLADERAAAALRGGGGLARCLLHLASQVAEARQPALAVGMAAYRSRLGQRIERLCAADHSRPLSTHARRVVIATVCGSLLILTLLAPGATAVPYEPSPGDSPMRFRSDLPAAWLMASLSFASPAIAEDPPKPAAEVKEAPASTADAVTDALRGFDGQVAGIVRARKDGRVVLEVTKVVKVWDRSKASDPESLVGKKIDLGPSVENGRAAPLQAKFLEMVKLNDDARLNVRQVEAAFVITELTPEQRQFASGEAAPTRDRPREEPEVEAKPLTAEERLKFPEGARGLSGRLVGRLVSKDVEKGSLTLELVKVDRVWPGSKASGPKSLNGRTVSIEKVFGRFLDVLLTLKKGDGVQIEVKHVSGDGLVFLGEELKKVAFEEAKGDAKSEKMEKPDEKPAAPQDDPNAPAGLTGFRGILVGELVSADIEKGTFVFKMDRVKRTWPQNKAPKPESSKGKELTIEGVSGKWLDVLLTLKPGDPVEVEAFHVRGPSLKFPGEWLKKAEAETPK